MGTQAYKLAAGRGPNATADACASSICQRPRSDIALAVLGTGTNTWYEGWIPCGLLHDVGDAGENTAFTNITDNATQYGMLSIYKTIISDTHTSVPFFINTLLSRSLFAQEAQVRSLQQQYGY
jgi:hypothetical protein